MYRIILLILLLTSCSVYQPLEGLCYTDKEGTYLCEEPKEDEWDICKQWIDVDPEVWTNCMLLAQ